MYRPRPKKRVLDCEKKLQLIEEVKKRPFLYSAEDRKTSDQTSTAAWKEIAELLNSSEEEVKVRWKNIRDTYRRFMRNQKLKDPNIKIRWRFFKPCDFLKNYIFPEEENEEFVFEDTSNTIDDDFETGETKLNRIPFIKTEKDSDEVMIDADFDKDDFDGLQEFQDVSTNQDDYNLMFLKSLLPFFRKLEPTRNLMVRNKIQQILLNEISRGGE